MAPSFQCKFPAGQGSRLWGFPSHQQTAGVFFALLGSVHKVLRRSLWALRCPVTYNSFRSPWESVQSWPSSLRRLWWGGGWGVSLTLQTVNHRCRACCPFSAMGTPPLPTMPFLAIRGDSPLPWHKPQNPSTNAPEIRWLQSRADPSGLLTARNLDGGVLVAHLQAWQHALPSASSCLVTLSATLIITVY